MNLLVSNGIFCFVVFLAFVVWIIVYLLRKIFIEKKVNQEISVLLGVCIATATFSMFGSGILYMHAPYSVMFWLALGRVLVIISENEELLV